MLKDAAKMNSADELSRYRPKPIIKLKRLKLHLAIVGSYM